MATSKITIEQYIGFEKKKENKEKFKVPFAKIIAFTILAAFCFVWILPFIIMFTGSLRGYLDNTLYPEELFYPHSGYTLENFKILLTGVYPEGIEHNLVNGGKGYPIGRWFFNSCFTAIGGTLLYLFVASLAAYGFTFIPFKFRDVLFTVLVFSMVIPGAATTVGNQTIVFSTGMNKSLLALIIPGLGGVYGMYLIRTFFSGIPKDLIESAKMDGYSNFKIFLKIVLPLGKTVLLVQGLFGFMAGWNDLIWPQMLYASKDMHMWTLQVGMAHLANNNRSVSQIGVALAGGVICLVPVFIVYLFVQRYIIEGMASAGIKG